MPDIDIAIHSAILIEENFKRNYDDDAEIAGKILSPEQMAEIEEQKLKI